MNKDSRSISYVRPRRQVSRLFAAAATATAVYGVLLFGAGPVDAQSDGVWNVTSSGASPGTNLWSGATNWQSSMIADGMDATADFSQLTLIGNETVHLDSPRTVGSLLFGDVGNTYNWALDNNQQAANTLTLASSYYYDPPAISVNSGTATIGAVITGNQGLTLNPNGQSGTLILSGANTYSGSTSIIGGTLQTGATNTLPASTDLTVTAGATLMLSGFSQSIDSITGFGNVTNNGLSPATLTLGADNGGNEFDGVLSDMPTGVTAKLSLAVVGFSIQTLTGTNTYTGSTTINGGTLNLQFVNPVAPTNIVNPASALVLMGGSLVITDRSTAAANLQTFNGTTIGPGNSTIGVNTNGNTSPASALVLGNISHAAGGTVTFALPTTGNITTTAHNTNGILGAWAIVLSQNQNQTEVDWAANSGVANAAGGSNIVAFSGYMYDYTDATGSTPTPNYGWEPGYNTSTISTSYQTIDTISSGSTTNSLRIAGGQNYTINLAGVNTIVSGGILVYNGGYGNSPQIGGSGALTTGLAANELAIITYAPYYGSGVLEISAAVVDNGTHTMGLSITGGELMLTNSANSYGGPTSVSAAQLDISDDHDLGAALGTPKAADLVLATGLAPDGQMAGATLQTAGTFTLNSIRGIALGPGTNYQGNWIGPTVSVQPGDVVSYGGIMADAGISPGSLTLTGGGTLFLSGKNTFSGGVLVEYGTLEIGSGAALGTTTANSSLTLGGSESADTTLQLAPNFSGSLSISQNISVTQPFYGNGTVYGFIDTNGNGTAAAPITYSGTLSVGPSYANNPSAVFIKEGVGVFEIDSTPTLFGGSSLAVVGGTLRLNYGATPANLLGAGVGATVSAGATLELAGGASQLSQAVNVANSGTLLVTSALNQNVGTITGGGNVVVSRGGLTAYQLIQNSLSISGGATVMLLPSGSGSTAIPANPNNTKFSSFLYSLSIAGTTNAWIGTLDIGNNGLVIAYENGPDPFTTIENMVESGYNGGAWTGTGITSSLAAAAAVIGSQSPALNIGLVDFTPGLNGNPTFTIFEGQILTTNAVLLRLTYMDDINLNGDMSVEDAAGDALIFAANVGTGTTWSVGDLTHDGTINSADALLFAANFVSGLPSLDGSTGNEAARGGAAAAAVPEPTTGMLALLGAGWPACCWMFRRRRESVSTLAFRPGLIPHPPTPNPHPLTPFPTPPPPGPLRPSP